MSLAVSVALIWGAITVICALVFYVALKRWDREDEEGRRKAHVDLLSGRDAEWRG